MEEVDSKKMSTSTFEAEMIEAMQTVKDTLFIEALLELKLPLKRPHAIFTDSQCVMDATKSIFVTKRSKNYTVKIWFVKKLIEQECIRLAKVEGENSIADIQTKILPKERYKKLKTYLYEERIAYLKRCVSLCRGTTQPESKYALKYQKQKERNEAFMKWYKTECENDDE